MCIWSYKTLWLLFCECAAKFLCLLKHTIKHTMLNNVYFMAQYYNLCIRGEKMPHHPWVIVAMSVLNQAVKSRHGSAKKNWNLD